MAKPSRGIVRIARHASIDIALTKHAAAADLLLFGLASCLIVHPELNFSQTVSQMPSSREETLRTIMVVGLRGCEEPTNT
jgi:hypothetical protein